MSWRERWERVEDDYKPVSDDEYEVVDDSYEDVVDDEYEVVEEDEEVVGEPELDLTPTEKWLVYVDEYNHLSKKMKFLRNRLKNIYNMPIQYRSTLSAKRLLKRLNQEYRSLAKTRERIATAIIANCPAEGLFCHKCPVAHKCRKRSSPKKIKRWFR